MKEYKIELTREEVEIIKEALFDRYEYKKDALDYITNDDEREIISEEKREALRVYKAFALPGRLQKIEEAQQ